MTKRQTYNSEPSVSVPAAAPRDVVKIEFAKRLQSHMSRKGWNQSELAREMERHVVSRWEATGRRGDKPGFGRDRISNYIRGASSPGPNVLHDLCAVLGVEPADLMPMRALPNVDDKLTPLEVKDIGGGQVWLRINQALPSAKAYRILAVLGEE